MENVQDGGFGGVIPFGEDADKGTIETVSPAVTEPTQVEPVKQEEVIENDKKTVEEEAGKEPQQQSVKDQAKKADQYHKQIIDLLEEKFKSVADGKMTPQELRQWFDANPDFAEKANRSKRLKDKFRPLMQSDEANRVNPEVAAKRAEQTQEVSEGEMVDDDKKPLTRKDLDSYFESREEKLLIRMSEKERKKELEEYAISKGLKDDVAIRFSKLAEVLYKNDPTFESFDEAKEAAYTVIKPSKPSPKGLQGGTGTSAIGSVESQMVDASEGPHIIDL